MLMICLLEMFLLGGFLTELCLYMNEIITAHILVWYIFQYRRNKREDKKGSIKKIHDMFGMREGMKAVRKYWEERKKGKKYEVAC